MFEGVVFAGEEEEAPRRCFSEEQQRRRTSSLSHFFFPFLRGLKKRGIPFPFLLPLFLSRSSVSSFIMGGDCCGGGPPPTAADLEALNGLSVASDGAFAAASANPSPSKAQRKADAAAAVANARPHSEYVAELQDFLARRIELFEQYRQRDVDKVRWEERRERGRGGERKRGRDVASEDRGFDRLLLQCVDLSRLVFNNFKASSPLLRPQRA